VVGGAVARWVGGWVGGWGCRIRKGVGCVHHGCAAGLCACGVVVVWAVCAGMDVAQVPLMDVAGSAVAAMDMHRGVVAVAEYGLGFLRNISSAEANRVRAAVEHRLCVHSEDGLWFGWAMRVTAMR
jgi:hypothetical protein